VTRSGGPVRAEIEGYGPEIRALRTAVGRTQQQLGDEVGVSRQTINAMESGSYAPSVFLALRVAKALGTTVEALWGTPG
jgi:putative transcriptional regulator